MRTVLYVLMEVMRHMGILYQPLMPASLNAILNQLGMPADKRDFVHLGREGCKIKLGREVIKPTTVFPRFEVPFGAAA
jgi:methionyl-tRNA synthetase